MVVVIKDVSSSIAIVGIVVVIVVFIVGLIRRTHPIHQHAYSELAASIIVAISISIVRICLGIFPFAVFTPPY